MISFQKCCDFHRHQKCDKCLSLVVFCSTDALVFDFAERCGAECSRYVDRLLALFAVLCFVSRQAVCPLPVPSELSPAQSTLFAALCFVSWQAVCPAPVNCPQHSLLCLLLCALSAGRQSVLPQ